MQINNEIELSMFGELRQAILLAQKDDDGDKLKLYLHALESFHDKEIIPLKQALFLEMGYRRAYLSGLFNK